MADRVRVRCCNEHGGREFFELAGSNRGVRIVTPGALRDTQWTREQARALRDALSKLIESGRNAVE